MGIMTNSIDVPVNTAAEALALVADCASMGLFAGVDYTWSYNPRTAEDYDMDDPVDPPSARFSFVEESMASFFRLKWA